MILYRLGKDKQKLLLMSNSLIWHRYYVKNIETQILNCI